MILKGRIPIKKADLNLKMMLEGGQCFRWKAAGSDQWIGVFSEAVWSIKQSEAFIDYTVNTKDSPKTQNSKETASSEKESEQYKNILFEYLRLEEPITTFYEDWASKDEHFKKAAVQCCGIRMLKQHPVENLFSFICSSNNNIPRISSMVEKMCRMYGSKIADIDEQSFYSFPEISKLAPGSVEEDLRKAGFGYRAKFIQKSAEKLVSLGGVEWLEQQQKLPYDEAKFNLIKLPGIGAKVADCICLMSLNHLEAVPVDTHVFQIASQKYLPHLRSVKTVTDRVYNEIGDFFRDLYGPYAGWAHTVLFCDDLKMFKVASEAENSSRKPTKRKKSTKAKDKGERKVEIVSGTLNFSKKDLYLRVTLNCGQTYRWKEVGKDVWQGVFASRVWTLEQHENYIEYTMKRFIPLDSEYPVKVKHTEVGDVKTQEENKRKKCEELLKDYFRLNEPLDDLYFDWAKRDQHFKTVSQSFYGLRMTKQDIVENLFAFVCSSNNTITRITAMVESLCSMYGEEIAEIDGVLFYDFPDVSLLCGEKVEENLRSANFGFRAKYIVKSAENIVRNGGKKWFTALQSMPYEKAKEELMKLPGIGAKVADCICLTALDHLNTIPVDTHVFQIAKKFYLPHLTGNKTVTEKVYHEIGNHFRTVFGHFAGWAHTVLFCSDLKIHSKAAT